MRTKKRDTLVDIPFEFSLGGVELLVEVVLLQEIVVLRQSCSVHPLANDYGGDDSEGNSVLDDELLGGTSDAFDAVH